MTELDRNQKLPDTCSHCGTKSLHTRRLLSGGSHDPYFLRGLGEFLRYAFFDVVVCAHCGLTQLFAEPSAYSQLPHNDWTKIE
jgi:rRNA maturation protein Nop10